MALTQMYPGMDNSPKTILTAGITATTTSISVEDTAVFPPGPNLATIGTGDNAEVITYTSISGGALQGCVRGVGGTARVWAAGANIYRAYTNRDHQIFIDNISALDADKLSRTGDRADVTVAFTEAITKTNISTGEKLSKMFGKIAKWYSSFKGLAWKNSVATNDIDSGAVTNAKHAGMPAKTIKGNADSAEAAPSDLSPVDVRNIINVAENADVTHIKLRAAAAKTSLEDADKLIIGDSAVATGDQTRHVLWSTIKAAIVTALQNTYAAKAHAAAHKTGGADPLTPGDIGAAPAAEEISAMLTAAGWTDGANTITGLTGITADSNGVVSLSDAATMEQREAARAALFHKTGQAAGSITITADGTAPAIDIPITILIV